MKFFELREFLKDKLVDTISVFIILLSDILYIVVKQSSLYSSLSDLVITAKYSPYY